MRKVTFGVANSLDNFIARPDGAVDWLLWSSEVGAITQEYWKTIDTVIMGRKTYEAGAKEGMASYGDVKTYVVSRTLTTPPHPSIELVSSDPVALLRELKARPGKGICVMGGGELAAQFLDADLLDEVSVNIHPIVLGDGIPLFPVRGRQIPLALRECRQLSTGCIVLRYDVVRSGG